MIEFQAKIFPLSTLILQEMAYVPVVVLLYFKIQTAYFYTAVFSEISRLKNYFRSEILIYQVYMVLC